MNTTDRTLARLAAARVELNNELDELRRIRILISRGLRMSSMSPDEQAVWRLEVSAALKGTGVKLAEESR